MKTAFNKKTEVIFETTEECFDCKVNKECPLISCIKQEAVVLRVENIEIKNCPVKKIVNGEF